MFNILDPTKNIITQNSVKEAFDTMPVAVCYFTSSGMVKLCNLQMRRLYRVMARSDLQLLSELHSALDDCGLNEGIIKIRGNASVYVFPDGKAWKYSEKNITTTDGEIYTEAIFADVTVIYEKKLELEKQAKQLRDYAETLKRFSQNVMTVTREKEILSLKTSLHDIMGEGLLAARRMLMNESSAEDAQNAIILWKKAVEFMKFDNETKRKEDDYEEFLRLAECIGVKIILNGSLPEDSEIKDLLLIVVRECFTNCVRHAEADEMYIEIREKSGALSAAITNNGIPPKKEIVPGGGLNNLSHIVNDCGGTMEIQSFPIFSLRINIPYRKEALS